MNIDEQRSAATQLVKVFRSRYQQFGEDYFPLRIAVRWEQAVHAEQIDLGQLREVLDSAKGRQEQFDDIAFFAFCNHMEKVVRDCLRSSFG